MNVSSGSEAARHRKIRGASPWLWNAALLVFVTGALAASVMIPAQATSHIIELFQELDNVIEPARRAATGLQDGLDQEAAALQDYTRAGDIASLHRYRATVAGNDRQLLLLTMLADQISRDASADVSEVRGDLVRWRQLSNAGHDSRYASIRRTLNRLQLRLADENQGRRSRSRPREGWAS
jgi:hypothetical protein